MEDLFYLESTHPFFKDYKAEWVIDEDGNTTIKEGCIKFCFSITLDNKFILTVMSGEKEGHQIPLNRGRDVEDISFPIISTNLGKVKVKGARKISLGIKISNFGDQLIYLIPAWDTTGILI